MEANDAVRIREMGWHYHRGERVRRRQLNSGVRRQSLDMRPGYHNIANVYNKGEGVENDDKKAKHYYWELLVTMEGYSSSRYNLGVCSTFGFQVQ